MDKNEVIDKYDKTKNGTSIYKNSYDKCMKKLLFIIFPALCTSSCKTTSIINVYQPNLAGIYKQNNSTKKLELNPLGDFILYNAEIDTDFVIEQCEYASKGKWEQLTNDIIEITSEDYSFKQEGFKYDLIKENKLSQDTLYIKINMPQFFSYQRAKDAIHFFFYFNHNNVITTTEPFIKLSKEKHLWKNNNNNYISFNIYTNASETPFVKSRLEFDVFQDYIDTGKYNYLTFTLPNFDLCFFDFEPFKHELIYLKNENELVWQGDIWKKVK